MFCKGAFWWGSAVLGAPLVVPQHCGRLLFKSVAQGRAEEGAALPGSRTDLKDDLKDFCNNLWPYHQELMIRSKASAPPVNF
jgi:hypothetical protein